MPGVNWFNERAAGFLSASVFLVSALPVYLLSSLCFFL